MMQMDISFQQFEMNDFNIATSAHVAEHRGTSNNRLPGYKASAPTFRPKEI